MPTTHEVLNQPPPLENYNLLPHRPRPRPGDRGPWWEGFQGRAAGVRGESGVGRGVRGAFLANTNDPLLHTHHRYGHRIDQVEFHPSWHSLIDLAISNGLHSPPGRTPTIKAKRSPAKPRAPDKTTVAPVIMRYPLSPAAPSWSCTSREVGGDEPQGDIPFMRDSRSLNGEFQTANAEKRVTDRSRCVRRGFGSGPALSS